MDGYVTKPVKASELDEAILDLTRGAALVSDRTPAPEPSSAGGDGQEAAPADLTALRETVGGDEELIAELAGLFVEDAPSQVEDIRGAILQGDAGALNEAAHKLKGAVANFGATAAQELAYTLEKMGREGRLVAASATFDALEREIGRLLTSKNRPEDLASGLDAGADDYVIKPFDATELRARLKVGERVIGFSEALLEANSLLKTMALTDAHTGLLNHGASLMRLEEEHARQDRTGLPLSVLMADIDHFKVFNDTYSRHRCNQGPCGSRAHPDRRRSVTRLLRWPGPAGEYQPGDGEPECGLRLRGGRSPEGGGSRPLPRQGRGTRPRLRNDSGGLAEKVRIV